MCHDINICSIVIWVDCVDISEMMKLGRDRCFHDLVDQAQSDEEMIISTIL